MKRNESIKKKWGKPITSVQQFVPQEYIAACIVVNCYQAVYRVDKDKNNFSATTDLEIEGKHSVNNEKISITGNPTALEYSSTSYDFYSSINSENSVEGEKVNNLYTYEGHLFSWDGNKRNAS